MQFGRFRHKGLRQLYEDDNTKGVPPAMAAKLRKLLLSLETADTLDQVSRFPGWKLHPLKGDLKGFWSRQWKLAVDFRLRRKDEYCRGPRLDRLPLGGLKCP